MNRIVRDFADKVFDLNKIKRGEIKMAEEVKKIKVFVARLGSEPVPITLPEGSSVADALREAKVTVREVAVNGVEATMNTKLEEDDFIAAVPKQIDGGV